MSQIKNKTGKREYALILMGVLLYSIYQNNVEMVEIIIWPCLSFIATVAGIHIYDKTTSRAGVTQSNNDNNESL